jgi:iron complex outermembrane receptor protein
MMRKEKLLLVGSAVAMGMSCMQSAQAQTPEASDRLEEVIVTAQKREQSVQEVPQAVQVINADQLASASIHEFADLTRIAPSLVIKPAEHPVNASVSIRGIGTFAFSIGVEPSVAVQVDDVPVAFQARAFADLSDVQRIEVLRGPQSTLYGKAASAGLINIVTFAPTESFEGTAHVLGTTDQEFIGGLGLSGPIGETLGYRLSAQHTTYDGNVKNNFNGDKTNGRESTTVSGKLVWDPSENFTATLAANYIDGETTVGRPFVRLAPDALLRNDPTLPNSVTLPGVVADADNTEISNNFAAGTDYTGHGGSLKLEVGLPAALTLVSISAYDRFELHDLLDQDDTSAPTISNFQIGEFESKQLTQEIRLLSSDDQALRYTLGLYYGDTQLDRDFIRGPLFSLARWVASADSKQKAIFGQADWEFIEGTTLTAGIRHQEEDIDYTFLDIQNGSAFFDGDASDRFETYRAGLQHQFTDDIMVYAAYATGHKGQTFDLTTGFNLNRQLAGPVLPETSKSYEIGARTQFLDGRLTLNASVFDVRYDDFQAQGIEFLPDGSFNFRLSNVGKVRTRGVEIDSLAAVGQHLKVNASLAYVDAVIEDFPLGQCYPGQTAAQGCSGTPTRQDLSGKRPPQAPEFKATAGFDFSRPLNGGSLQGVLQGSYVYQSAINYALSVDPQGAQGGYGILNLSLGVRDADRGYEVIAFVNNALDKQYYANYANSNGNFGNRVAINAVLPRDFERYAGVRVKFDF